MDRFWRGIAIILCILNCSVVWAQKNNLRPVPKYDATLSIRLDPQGDTASASLSVFSPRPVSVDSEEARQQTRLALEKAFGRFGNDALTYEARAIDNDHEESYDEDGDPLPGYTPPPVTTSSPLNWYVSVSGLGGANNGPIRRKGFLQSGQFDPAPVQNLLRSVGVDKLDVMVSFQGRDSCPVRQCTNANPIDSSTTSRKVRRTSVFRATIPVGTTYPPLIFRVGYEWTDLFAVILPALSVPFFAILTFLWYRGKAIRAFDRADQLAETDVPAAERTRKAIRFGMLRVMNVGVPVLSAIWGATFLFLQPTRPFLWLGNVEKLSAAMAWGFTSYAVPLILALLVCSGLSIPVLRRADPRDSEPISLARVLQNTGGPFLLSYVPTLLTILAIGSLLDNFTTSMLPMWLLLGRENSPLLWKMLLRSSSMSFIGWGILALIARPMVQKWLVASGENTPLVLTAGSLLERVNTLAKQTGVAVRQIVILQTGRDQVANAFAVVGNILVLTDKLLADLTRREVDGVIAHELAHLKRGHPKRIQYTQTIFGWLPVGTLLYLSLTGRLPGDTRLIWAIVIPASTLLTFLITRAQSRRFEVEADIDAVAITGDPQGLILGLARLGRMSGMPEDWGNIDAGLLTHPSTARRIEYLSAAGKLSTEERELLQTQFNDLDSPAEESDHYRLPERVRSSLVFSQGAILKNAITLGFGMKAILVLVPVLFAHLAEQFGVTFPVSPQGISMAMLREWRTIQTGVTNLPILVTFYVLGAIATIGGLIAYINRVGTTFYCNEQPVLLQRFQEMGKLTASESSTAIYVSIVPGTVPRNFGGSQAWDTGFVVLGESGLRFVGEKEEFSVTAAQIRELQMATNSFPSWVPVRKILLSWTDSDGNSASMLLAPANVNRLGGVSEESNRLLQTLSDWRAATMSNESHTPFPVPDWSKVVGLTPNDLARPKLFLPVVAEQVCSGIGVAIVTGLPLRGIVFCALVIATVLFTEWVRFSTYRVEQPRTG